MIQDRDPGDENDSAGIKVRDCRVYETDVSGDYFVTVSETLAPFMVVTKEESEALAKAFKEFAGELS